MTVWQVLGSGRSPVRHPFRLQLGDLPTWLLAIFALGALIAAGLAYLEQRKAAADQRKATAALSDQAEAQRKALDGQQAANRIQGEALEAQLRDMNRRAEAVARQQADCVDVAFETVDGTEAQVWPEGEPVPMIVVDNKSRRPIRSVACKLCVPGAQMRLADAWGGMRNPNVSPGPGENAEFVFRSGESAILVLRAGCRGAFAWGQPGALGHPGYQICVRFTDDAGLHWQITTDLHMEQLAERDW